MMGLNLIAKEVQTKDSTQVFAGMEQSYIQRETFSGQTRGRALFVMRK